MCTNSNYINVYILMLPDIKYIFFIMYINGLIISKKIILFAEKH